MNDAPPRRRVRHWLGVALTTLVCLAILGGSAAAVVVINQTEPKAEKLNATRKSAALVETMVAHRGDYSPNLMILGTVQPAQDILLSPRIRGEVLEVSEQLVPGAMVRKGDLLFKIDPADFENALSVRISELDQVKASLEIEQGRQTLAKKELALLEETIGEANRALVLREPQMASIRAELRAAEAQVERARLDLERTRVHAPFDAQVLTRSVSEGSQVAPGDEVARLVGIDQYWIIATLPVRSLRWVQFPDKDGYGSEALVRDEDAWAKDVVRRATVTRMIGTLDQQTRLARLLLTVEDPLGRESDEPPLILDTLVDTTIRGKSIPSVVRIPREFVRDQDTVWVMVDGKLEIRNTVIEFQDAEFAYISEGVEEGEEIVISTLATVANGVGLRKISSNDSSDTQGSIAEEGN